MSDDKVHPSSKPATATAATTTNPSKPQLRPAVNFRPNHHNRNSHRNICCSLCCYIFLILFFILALVAATVTVFYLLFHPKPPSFSLTSLTSSSYSSSSFDLTLSATNPNSKVAFFYQPASISILSGDTSVAGGIVPAFVQSEKNTTVLVASIESSGTTTTMTQLRNDAVLPVKVQIVTKVEATIMGVLKTPRVGITVLCDGVSVSVPAAGSKKTAVAPEPTAAEPTAEVEADPTADVVAEPTAATATVKTSGCAVDVRFKVWKWIV